MKKQMLAIEFAARRVLAALSDDHEDCLLCGATEHRSHESGSACRELEDAINDAHGRKILAYQKGKKGRAAVLSRALGENLIRRAGVAP